jgi:hypothetical protein
MTLGKNAPTTLLERAADRTSDAVETAVELTQEFIEHTAKPALHDAAAKTAPIVAAGAGMAAERAAQAKQFAETKSAELTGHPKPKKRRGRKMLLWLVLGGAAAAVAVVARRFMGGSSEWTAPEPAPASTPENPAETVATDAPVEDLTTPINEPPYSSN